METRQFININPVHSNRRRMMLAFLSKPLVMNISPTNLGNGYSFSRASTATFTDNTTGSDLSVSPTSLGSGYTFTRASTATYTDES